MLLVFDVQVFQGRDEGLSLEASGCPGHHWGVADSTVCSDGDNVAPQGRPHVAHLVHSLGYTTDMEPPAEVNAVQDLPGRIKYLRHVDTASTAPHTVSSDGNLWHPVKTTVS